MVSSRSSQPETCIRLCLKLRTFFSIVRGEANGVSSFVKVLVDNHNKGTPMVFQLSICDGWRSPTHPSYRRLEKWGLSTRRVQILCNENRIDGAARVGSIWVIPATASKPRDARIKSWKYIGFRKKLKKFSYMKRYKNSI